MGERTATRTIDDPTADETITLTDVDGRTVMVCYDSGIPPRFREALPRFVSQLLFLVPAKVRRIVFDYGQDEEDKESDSVVPASVVTSDDYLMAQVTLSDSWLTMGDFQRMFSLMHEFVHLHESECYHFARRFIEEALAPGDERPGAKEKCIVDELRRKYESQTQELTHVLMQKLWPEIKRGLDAWTTNATS